MNTTNNNTTVKAINRFATVRNYVIGFYIVEYEQHGSDRAKYGDRLLKRLAEKVNKRGINETLLKNCRNFYRHIYSLNLAYVIFFYYLCARFLYGMKIIIVYSDALYLRHA